MILYFMDQSKSLDVTTGGTGYDIINPPRFVINDTIGSGATGFSAVEGS